MVVLVGHSAGIECGANGGKMFLGSFIERVPDAGQRGDDGLIFRMLAIEHPQGVGDRAPLAILAHARDHRLQGCPQGLHVSRPVGGRADGVEQQFPARNAQFPEQGGQHFQHFRVAQRRFAARAGRPDHLGANLKELAVAALLRPFPAELRPDVVELLQLAGLAQLVLNVGADHAGGILRAQGQGLPDSPWIRASGVKVYISLETMSVSSPTPRAKSCVSSKIGVRISPKE